MYLLISSSSVTFFSKGTSSSTGKQVAQPNVPLEKAQHSLRELEGTKRYQAESSAPPESLSPMTHGYDVGRFSRPPRDDNDTTKYMWESLSVTIRMMILVLDVELQINIIFGLSLELLGRLDDRFIVMQERCQEVRIYICGYNWGVENYILTIA